MLLLFFFRKKRDLLAEAHAGAPKTRHITYSSRTGHQSAITNHFENESEEKKEKEKRKSLNRFAADNQQ